MLPDGEGRAPTRPGLTSTPTTATPPSEPQSARIVAHGGDGRARQLHRLAVVESVELAYGPAARLVPSPAGPAACPPGCRWCAARWPTDWWGWAA